MNTRNVDLINFVVFLFVIVFLVGPFLGIVAGFLSTPPLNVVTVAIGAFWLLSSAFNLFRGNRASVSRTKVTYWRGERFETRVSARERARSVAGVPLLVTIWLGILGLGCTYAAVVLLLQLVNVL